MKGQYKPFLISIICEILFAFLFLTTTSLGYDNSQLFWNHLYERVFIAIIWPIIGLIRNTKEKNTKYLKTALIIIEIYLLLLVFVQDWSNFNKREFFVLYLAILWLIKETIYKRYKRRQTIFFSSIYWITAIIIISIWCFMRYREPINYEKILDQQEYLFLTKFNENLKSKTTTITLSNDILTENIDDSAWTKTYPIRKNKEYTLSFISQRNNKSNYIIIQDQLWNLVQIFPQTSITFWTKNYQIQYRDPERKTNYYAINSEFPKELEHYKTNYNESIKNTILSNLPTILRENPKFQKISANFTKILAKIFPFWYKDAWKILEEYLPYFDIQETKEYENITNQYEMLKTNGSIGIKNTNWWDKYSEYFKKIFYDSNK